jgi:predicted nucleic acid-binding protein
VRLKEVPAGSRIFIDTNIFFYQIVKLPTFWEPCEAFLERVKARELEAFTSVAVLNELLYKLVLAEVAQREGIPDHQAFGFISHNPKVLGELKTYGSMDKLEAIPNLSVLEVGAADFLRSRDFMKSYHLLPSDALHLAVMERQGIEQLASNDKAFRRLPSIKVYWL